METGGRGEGEVERRRGTGEHGDDRKWRRGETGFKPTNVSSLVSFCSLLSLYSTVLT